MTRLFLVIIFYYIVLIMKQHYDVLLVGAGLFNAVLAYYFNLNKRSVLVVEKRNHIAGNCYDEVSYGGDTVHKYGAHIFHTSNEEVWSFVNHFTKFNNYINSPIANYNGEIYNLPFNMNTFSKMFNVSTPTEVKKKIQQEINMANIGEPKNLEEQAIKMVGITIYNKLIRGYTEKQWGKSCKELSSDIIKRLPLRFTYNNNYFNDKYQGIPEEGYTKMIEKMYDGCDILLETDFLANKEYYEGLADKVYYSGCIDEYYGYKFGTLEYRGLRFEEKMMTSPEQLQGVAVMNFTDIVKPYTRRIQHWYFNQDKLDAVLADDSKLFRGTETYEYPADWKPGETPYYPVNNARNAELYDKYKSIPNDKVVFCGRLGQYKYYDMDDTIAAALELCRTIFPW